MKSSRLGAVAGNSAAYVTTLIFLLPVYVLVNLAIRPKGDLTPALVPSSAATFDNFIAAWTQSSLPSAIVTSLFVTITSCVIVIVLATMAAYPLARSTARWSTFVFFAFMVGLLLPFQLSLLPLYMQMRDFGLLGNPISLVIVYSGVQLPFAVFLITTFLRSGVPIDYEEAAHLDGCGNIRTFWHVVVPLLRPALGTVVILTAVAIWNDFFTPLIYLAGGQQLTIPMAIYQFVGRFSSDWALIFSSLIISMLPVLLLYLVFQRYVIQGFAGGLKG